MHSLLAWCIYGSEGLGFTSVTNFKVPLYFTPLN
jgi:hypothetical protein